MEKNLILITGSVMNSHSESINIYNDLLSLINADGYIVSSPLDTMKFQGTNEERYKRALDMLSKTKIMIAEVSSVSTGQGIEIGHAATLNIPIMVIAKEGSKVSGLIKGCPVVKRIVYYNNIIDLKDELESFIKEELYEKHSINRS